MVLTAGHRRYFHLPATLTVYSDKDGCVPLGDLKNIKTIKVEANSSDFNVNRTWTLNRKEALIYPDQVDALEGQSIEFPVFFNELTRKKVSLVRTMSNHDLNLEDLYDQIEFVKQENKEYNIVRLKLPVGQYQIGFEKIQKTLDIEIHKGTKWETDTFIHKTDCLFENRQPFKIVKISNI